MIATPPTPPCRIRNGDRDRVTAPGTRSVGVPNSRSSIHFGFRFECRRSVSSSPGFRGEAGCRVSMTSNRGTRSIGPNRCGCLITPVIRSSRSFLAANFFSRSWSHRVSQSCSRNGRDNRTMPSRLYPISFPDFARRFRVDSQSINPACSPTSTTGHNHLVSTANFLSSIPCRLQNSCSKSHRFP